MRDQDGNCINGEELVQMPFRDLSTCEISFEWETNAMGYLHYSSSEWASDLRWIMKLPPFSLLMICSNSDIIDFNSSIEAVYDQMIKQI